jgi:exodeoxyribonuclease V beta subunit
MKQLQPDSMALEGTTLIEASAGTGKTYTITSLFVRLILDGFQLEQVLAVTFTEAATSELRDRIRGRLVQALAAIEGGHSDDPFLQYLLARPGTAEHVLRNRIRAALGAFDEAAIFTIHGFCHRVLQENAFESNMVFDAELMTDARALYREIVFDFWTRQVFDLPEIFIRLLQQNRIAPDSLMDLALALASEPDRKVLPPDTDFDMTEGRLHDLYQTVQDIWQNEGHDVKALLASHPGVNRRSYNKKNLARWLENVDAFLAPREIQNFETELNLDKFTQSRLQETGARLKKATDCPEHPFFSACEQLCTFSHCWCIAFKRQFMAYAREALSTRKIDQRVLFFDDLIQNLDRALQGSGAKLLASRIRERYPAALIDEFQDTDLAQYRIFNRIYQGTGAPFFLIGDPKQSIYAFRGADIFAYLAAVTDAGDRSFTLGVNWRSDPGLIQAVNTLFGRVENPFFYKQIGFSPVAPRPGVKDEFTINGHPVPSFKILFVRRDPDIPLNKGLINKGWIMDHLPDRVAADIARLLARDNSVETGTAALTGPGDIAVLVRTNRQARLMQQALARLNVPCVLTSRESVFLSPDAMDLYHLLSAIADPVRDHRVAAALCTAIFGITGDEIHSFRENEADWEDWVMHFRSWHATWQGHGFIQMMQTIFFLRPGPENPSVLARLLALPGGERQVANLDHLVELLHGVAVEQHLGMPGLLRWFELQLSATDQVPDTFEMRLESDATAVQLVTIHKSKGLEYKVVYAPFLWDGRLYNNSTAPARFHDPSDHGPVLDLGSSDLDDHLALAGREEMAENLRLLYVALTRARHHCRVVWGAVRDFETSPLAYLLHQPKHEPGHKPEHTIDPAADLKTLAGYVRSLGDTQILGDLNRLADDARGAIAVETLLPDTPEPYQAPGAGDAPLECRHNRRHLHPGWVTASFSKLVADAKDLTPDEDKGRDHDPAGGEVPLPAIELSVAPVLTGDQVVPLAEFSRGVRAGNFFHGVYEDLDFTCRDRDTVKDLVVRKLETFGFDPAEWKMAAEAVMQTVATGLDHDQPGLKLGAVAGDHRFNELEFIFPVAGGGAEQGPVNAEHLAALFSRYGSRAIPEPYPRQIAHLGFAPLKGFLKGFIDLIFEFQGRWYVVDYKSNFLGKRFFDYTGDRLTHAMAHHHYFLQYHIYTTALHRFLAWRQPGYDYKTHFGGVYYLFIRGMSPETGPDCGVFRDRPALELIEGLSKLFEGVE